MTMSNADGSVILSTHIDTTGILRGMKQISLLSQKTGEKINLDFVFATKAIDKLALALSSVQAQLLLVLAVKKFIEFSDASANAAIQTEASVQRLVDIYGSASDAVGNFIDQNARALGMSKSAAASFSSVYGNLFSAFADQETNAALTNEYLQMTAVVASKTGRTVEDVQERIRSGLLGNTEAIEDLGIFVNVKTIEMTDAFQRMANGKSWEQLDTYTQQQIRAMAILEQSTAKYGDEISDTATTIRNQYNAAYEDFQNSWGTIVNQILLPALKVLTEVFNIATVGLNALSGRSGKILEDAETNADASSKTADNIKKQADNQKELNDQTKKTLAGFDDIQILSKGTKEETEPITFENPFKNMEFDGSGSIEETSETMKRIMRIIGGALVGLGVLLLMTKNPKTIGWGIGFIITGAAMFGVSAATAISEASDLGVGAVIATIMGIIGDALVAVGIILLFKGQIPWGIGFIVAGAALMAIEYFATTEFSTDPVENTLIKIMGILGTVLAAVGILLCIFGGPAALPWGIGLIIAGAVAFVSAAAISSDAIVEAIRGPIGVIMAIAGTALLVLGIMLTCTGNLILGIPLILAGAVGLVTPIALNADAIVDWISRVWDAVKNFWNTYIAPVFTAKFWLDLAKTCGNGLIGGFEAAINGIIGMFEKMINWIVKGLNKISFDVPDWVPGIGGKTFGFNISEAKFGRISIPRLAQGTVVPPNKEFMAILGDNTKEHEVVSPLSTIQEAVSAVVSSQNEETQYILREILEAIHNIQIGDEVIGRASQRYNNSMIKMYGG